MLYRWFFCRYPGPIRQLRPIKAGGLLGGGRQRTSTRTEVFVRMPSTEEWREIFMLVPATLGSSGVV
eukprot:scaffold229964_cov21-Prasinocladus_malaysianus.AAC.1